ncbi:uncharacterized protein LOC113315654 [Papaver somniferum]|uniref:uncharacterized protein LOC113315654 n=1 Tax=Papaver somniferum TaxID=3469 RepID=UPI000E705DC4|nr:uncharacterized protein LOC113315654 [Papaver somniferum]
MQRPIKRNLCLLVMRGRLQTPGNDSKSKYSNRSTSNPDLNPFYDPPPSNEFENPIGSVSGSPRKLEEENIHNHSLKFTLISDSINEFWNLPQLPNCSDSIIKTGSHYILKIKVRKCAQYMYHSYSEPHSLLKTKVCRHTHYRFCSFRLLVVQGNFKLSHVKESLSWKPWSYPWSYACETKRQSKYKP